MALVDCGELRRFNPSVAIAQIAQALPDALRKARPADMRPPERSGAMRCRFRGRADRRNDS